MKFAGVSASGEWVPDDDDVELTALEDVGGVDDDLIDWESGSCARDLKPGADVISLVAMGDADGDVTGLQTSDSVLVLNGDVRFKELFNDVDDRVDRLRVGLRHDKVVQFE